MPLAAGRGLRTDVGRCGGGWLHKNHRWANRMTSLCPTQQFSSLKAGPPSSSSLYRPSRSYSPLSARTYAREQHVHDNHLAVAFPRSLRRSIQADYTRPHPLAYAPARHHGSHRTTRVLGSAFLRRGAGKGRLEQRQEPLHLGAARFADMWRSSPALPLVLDPFPRLELDPVDNRSTQPPTRTRHKGRPATGRLHVREQGAG